MEKTISDTTFKMYINANREYDNYPSCTSTVSNTESFEASTSDKANGSETCLEHENYLENTITADKIRSTSQPPSSTFTIIRSLFTSLKSSVMVRHFDDSFFLYNFKQIKELYLSMTKKCITK